MSLLGQLRKTGTRMSSPALKHKLVIPGKDPKLTEVTNDKLTEMSDLETLHKEDGLIMVQRMAQIVRSGTKSVMVISDDTDVFVLLLYLSAERIFSIVDSE